MGPSSKRLGVLVDGAPLPDLEARALWERFSAWMEEHRGDLAGFAAQEGYASVHPGVDGDRPVLRASKSAPQGPYAPVGTKPPSGSSRDERSDRGGQPSGGSLDRQGGSASPDRRSAHPRDLTTKPRK